MELTIGYPDGFPVRWQDEQSGQLPAAISAYLKNRTERGELTAAQFDLVKAYLVYYIGAPCWKWAAGEEEGNVKHLAHLRQRIQNAQAPASIQTWIHACLEIGIDPL